MYKSIPSVIFGAYVLIRIIYDQENGQIEKKNYVKLNEFFIISYECQCPEFVGRVIMTIVTPKNSKYNKRRKKES